MSRIFETRLQELKTALIRMGSLVEIAIDQSIESIKSKNRPLAEQIIRDDQVINELELTNETIIVDLLALQQPVASDLRFILAASKINNDLERIGDHAVNLAESSLSLQKMDLPSPAFQGIDEMAQVTKRMFSDALDCFIHIDSEIGECVLKMDDTADGLNRTIGQEMMKLMKTHPQSIELALELIRVSRNLERVADLATNIAEEVVFIANAKVVKHHFNDHTESPS
jgi:phosphate transport system protein